MDKIALDGFEELGFINHANLFIEYLIYGVCYPLITIESLLFFFDNLNVHALSS